MNVRCALLLVLALGLEGCGLLGPSEVAVEVRMDSSAYHRPSPSEMAIMGFQVVNVSSHTAYFEGCPDPIPVAFERDLAGRWQDDVSSNSGCIAILSSTRLELRPGQSYHYAVRWDFPSRYRFRVYFGNSPDAPHARSALGAPFDLQ